ncbi:hypothetical protein NE865_10514 [Phthorimaea operculella]|nr:hypothetical protein NE865_10514 [Phthorimaea operculella]
MPRKRHSPKGAHDTGTTISPTNNGKSAVALTSGVPAKSQPNNATSPDESAGSYSSPPSSNINSPKRNQFFSPTVENLNKSNFCGSAPDLSVNLNNSYENALPHVTQRQKRTYRDFQSDDLSSFMGEFRSTMAKYDQKQEQKFQKMQDCLNAITIQNGLIQDSIKHMSDKYDELHKKIDHYEAERKLHIQIIGDLENKVDNMERQLRSSSIEIRNIPLKPTEKKNDLIKLVKNIGSQLNVPLGEENIKDIFRFPSKNPSNKPIVVDFISTLTKEKVLFAVKQQKQEKKNLMSAALDIDGPSVPVFISENLTAKNKRLFALARETAKQINFKYCWSSHGTVYLRRADGEKIIRINSDQDLEAFKNLTK